MHTNTISLFTLVQFSAQASNMASSSHLVNVPADDLCFYHCVGAAARGTTGDFPRSEAISRRSDICRIVGQMGFQEEASRLMQPGSSGYPDELAFAAAAQYLAGTLEVVTMSQEVRVYGEGLCKLRIHHTMTYDGAGHGSPHFEIAYVHAPQQSAESVAASVTIPGEVRRVRKRLLCKTTVHGDQGPSDMAQLSRVYEEMSGRQSVESLWSAVQSRGLSYSRRRCEEFLQRQDCNDHGHS